MTPDDLICEAIRLDGLLCLIEEMYPKTYEKEHLKQMGWGFLQALKAAAGEALLEEQLNNINNKESK